MNRKNFDAELEKKLPMVAMDEQGRWFCASRQQDAVRFEFFENEEAARTALEQRKQANHSSN
ncbi:MAG TPA: hypothetical protein VJU77_09955 [Chthoniobacterales bacterium]|nr:hypothetical protein [Chthoniobacterales bacterium]